MAATTDRKDETNAMSDDDRRDEDRDREEERDDEKLARRDYSSVPSPQRREGSSPSFFTIYKRGQGYWTRMCTAGGAILIIGLTDNFLYRIALLELSRGWKTGIVAAFTVLAALVVWWVMNKPQNAEFLIATDSEMKKVNWTSRAEIIGSTKVVILFMFLIAGLLFVTDLFFSYFFWLIGVLKQWYFS